MPVININLLRQEQRRVSGISQATLAVIIVTGSIVGLMLLIAVFLYTTIAIRSGQKSGLIKQRQEYEAKASGLEANKLAFYPDLNLGQQAIAYQSQVDAAKSLVDNHKYFTLYLTEIAQNTPSTIVYTAFSSDSVNRLSVSGVGDTYTDVAKLVESFNKLSFAKSATLQEAKLDQAKVGKGGSVKFVMIIELKSAAELKKLPSPSGESKPIPAATPGATPQPGGSPAPATAPPAIPNAAQP